MLNETNEGKTNITRWYHKHLFVRMTSSVSSEWRNMQSRRAVSFILFYRVNFSVLEQVT
jgi:hypothetical protein